MRKGYYRENQMLDKHNTVEKLFIEFEKGVDARSIPTKASQSLLIGNTSQSNKSILLNTSCKCLNKQTSLDNSTRKLYTIKKPTPSELYDKYLRKAKTNKDSKYTALRESFINSRSKIRIISDKYYLKQPIDYFFNIKAEQSKALQTPKDEDTISSRLRNKVLRCEVGSKIVASLEEKSLSRKVQQALDSARRFVKQ